MAKMKDIKVTRIDNLLIEKFDDEIDMSDTTYVKGSSSYFSRALAATALMMINKIESNEASIHITDGRDDFGIDSIYINNIQKTITVVQSKHRDNGSSTISRDEILLFEEGVRKLINSDYEGMNSKIQNLKSDLDFALTKSDFKIVLCLIYTGGELNVTLEKKINKFISEINGKEDEIASLRIINIDDIYTYVVVNQFEDQINIDDLCVQRLNYFDDPQETYYGLIKAADLVKIYKKYNNRIFSSNIRYFKGDTKVNEGIEEIIKTQKKYFHLYNNGIKAICKKIFRKPIHRTSYDIGEFELEGFSIVNGAQTTGTLAKFSTEELEDVYVFITIVSLENSEIDDLSKQITTLSNTQNKIEFVDFAALDKIHSNLKAQLKADGKDYVYMAGDEQPINCISLYSLTNALCCWKSIELSAYIKNGYNKVFKNLTKKPYTDLFSKDLSQYLAWNVAYYYEKITSLIIEKSHMAEGLDYSIPTHGFRFISNLVFDYLWTDNDEYTRVYLNFENDVNKIDEYIVEVIQALKSILSTEYKDEIIPNLFRTKKTAKELKQKVIDKLNEKVIIISN